VKPGTAPVASALQPSIIRGEVAVYGIDGRMVGRYADRTAAMCDAAVACGIHRGVYVCAGENATGRLPFGIDR